jgi:hypothetical protein
VSVVLREAEQGEVVVEMQDRDRRRRVVKKRPPERLCSTSKVDASRDIYPVL